MPPDHADVARRLLARGLPARYYRGANALGARLLRAVAVFARNASLSPSFDLHHRHLLVVGLGQQVGVVAGTHLHALGHGDALLVPPFTPHAYRDAGHGRQPLLAIGFGADLGDTTDDVSYLPSPPGRARSTPRRGRRSTPSSALSTARPRWSRRSSPCCSSGCS